MSHGGPKVQVEAYTDGRTKQSFKDSTDINMILQRAQRGESLSHLQRHGATYGDFSNVDDLLTAHSHVERGQQIFNELPSEVRKEFDQDMGKFFAFVNDPANAERLPEILPALAAPGRQLPAVRRGGDLNRRPEVVDPPADPTPQDAAAAETPPTGGDAS